MTQEEKWNQRYDEVVAYMNANHRNPSKHRQEVVEEIMKNDALRNYQQEMIDRLEDAWTRYRSVMVQMPTGTGKTVLLVQEIKNEELRMKNSGSGGVLVVAHRRELLEQIRKTIALFDIDMEKNQIVVESIQKLTRGGNKNTDLTDSTDSSSQHKLPRINHKFPFTPSLVIIDEAHHALAKTYQMLWEWWPKAKFLGLTATPCRMNNVGFTDLFQVLLQSEPISDFIEKGWLSDFEYITAEPDNPIVQQVAALEKRGTDGDYQAKEMALVMDCEESIEQLYKTYREFVDGKRGIVYAINREHALHITEYYQQQGLNCCWIEAKTPDKEREQLVQDYRDGLIDIVVNVDILGEGVDFPEVEFIQLARPTLSLSKYLQQVGRGMRISKGKDCVTILDHVGMYQAFGFPTEDWNWQLMFTGKLAGKAGIGREQLLYIRDTNSKEKELLDLKMVHVKRKDEEHHGLEIFMKDGLYGIAKDGKMIHPPLFESVKRSDDGYFAWCTYPYLVYQSRTTIIDKEGRDLKLRMYGSMEWDGDLLIGHDIDGKPLYWDRQYGIYYSEKPQFVTLAGVPMVKLKDGFTLRKYPSMIEHKKKRDIFYNGRIIWMGDWLIFKRKVKDGYEYEPKKIMSYGIRFFYVWNEGKYEMPLSVVSKDGNVEGYAGLLPEGERNKRPMWGTTPLINAMTGKEGYPDDYFRY